MNVIELRCVLCDSAYEDAPDRYTCDREGIDGILDVRFDMDRVAHSLTRETLAERPRTVWRYLELLPVTGARGVPQLQVGWTPLVNAERLARRHGLGRLLVKDEGRNPTASFKDRASSVGALRAIEVGATDIACSSTGNAASSLAGFAASLGLRATIFVPQRAPEAKLAQLRVFGARVLVVQGSYDQAYMLCQEAVATFGWYNRNCAVNARLVEGKKTAGLEIGEQLGGAEPDAGGPVDWVVVSVGDGCTIAGVWKGLVEMHTLGLLPRLPRLLGVQAAGADPIAAAFRSGEEKLPQMVAETFADSIAVDRPRNWVKALRAVRASHGALVSVSDEAIASAGAELARETGVFAEPAAAAAFAGVLEARASGLIVEGASVLALVTGSGLKDVTGGARAAPPAHRIEPTLDAVRAVVAGMDDSDRGSA